MRRAVVGVAAVAAASAGVAASSGPTNAPGSPFGEGGAWTERGACAFRLARAGWAAASIVAEYKRLTDESETKDWESAHERCAARLKALVFANRGVYLKVAQHLAILDYILPPAYTLSLSSCFDDTPRSTPAEVAAVFADEMGAGPQEVFETWDDEPIASASLAQVHKAKTHDGRDVAVKVQHVSITRSASFEIEAVSLLVRIAATIDPRFELQWLADEVRANLPRELDFNTEAGNAERCRGIVARFGESVVVPEVDTSLSSRRILTMSWEDGCRINEKDAIVAAGLDTRTISLLVSRVFCEMIHHSGFVHCDPHPGNVLVRKTHHGRPQIVLLDHGLYREIPDDLRLEYCRLWFAVVMGDSRGIQEASEKMGIKSQFMEEKFPGMELSHTLIAAMLLAKPYDQIALNGGGLERLERRGSDEEEFEELSSNVREYFGGILDVLSSCPRPVLLLLKTNDCLRSLSAGLGTVTAETCAVTAMSCISALFSESRSWWQKFRLFNALIKCKLYLWMRGMR